MAKNSVITKTGDGVTTQWVVNFTGGFLEEAHVTCQVNGEVDGAGDPLHRTITFINPGLIEVGGAVAPVGAPLLFERTTPIATAVNNFGGGTAFSAAAVDTSFLQVLFGVQEAQDQLEGTKDLEAAIQAVSIAETNAAASAVAADASASSVEPYADRASAQAATVPATRGTLSMTTSHGKLIEYVSTVALDVHLALTTNGGTRFWKPASELTPHHFGQIGSDTTANTAAVQATLDALKSSIGVANDGMLDLIPPTTVDLLDDDIVCDAPLEFADLFYVKLQNGQLRADAAATWAADSSLCNVSWETGVDIVRQQRIRNLMFDNMKINGGAVTNCVYAQNTYDLTIANTFLTNWVTDGFGFDTADRGTTPVKKNTHLKLLNVTAGQKELSVSHVGDGTAIRVRTADFYMDNCTVYKAAVGLDLQSFNNGQISNFHSFVDAANICWRVGPDCNHAVFTNAYSDTGRVVHQSFNHTYAGGIFGSSSVFELDAGDTVGEDGNGLTIVGGLFVNNPTYVSSGSGSWAAKKRVSFVGSRRTAGGHVFGSGIETGENGALALVSNDTQRFLLTGSGHIVPADGQDGNLDIGETGNTLRRLHAKTVFIGTTGAFVTGGTAADPNGSVVAPPGSFYLSSTGGVGATLWAKETGTGNTGWAAK